MPQSAGDSLRLDQLAVIDTKLANRSAAEFVASMFKLVNSNWTETGSIDVGTTLHQGILSNHRITTLIPLDRVRAADETEHRTRLATIYGAQMRIEETATRTLVILNQAGIDSWVLKGLASAELDYPMRSLRQTGDVDLAIRPDQLDHAVRALKSNGYTDHLPLPRSPHLLKGATVDAPNGIEIDLHTRLFRRSPHCPELFELDDVALADLPGRAFCAELRLVHAAGHLMVAPAALRRMSGLFDITLIRNVRQPDLQRSFEIAKMLNIEGLVGTALRIESILSDRGEGHVARSWPTAGWHDRLTRLTPTPRPVLDHLARLVRDVPRGSRLSYLPIWLTPGRPQHNGLGGLLKRYRSAQTPKVRRRRRP